MNVMERQKLKVALLRSCGRMEIPVQKVLLPSTILTGFSFEAGGWTFRPVVCHSTSDTLRLILAIFFTTVLYIFLTKASHELTD